MDSLKNFVRHGSTSSEKLREKLIEDLENSLQKNEIEDLPDGALKILANAAAELIPLYNTSSSRRLLNKLFVELVRKFNLRFFKAIVNAIDQQSRSIFKVHPHRNSRTTADYGFRYVSTLLVAANKNLVSIDVETEKILFLVASRFLSSILAASDDDRTQKLIVKRLETLFGQIENLENRWIDIFESIGEPDLSHLGMISALILLSNKKKSTNVDRLKTVGVDIYTKLVLGTRTKPYEAALRPCEVLLKTVDGETFKNKIFPTLNRSLLRNPEIIIDAVPSLFENIEFDLSFTGKDLAKLLAGPLISKNESLENSSLGAFRSLAKKIHQGSAAIEIVEFLFNILNGSESSFSKLSVINQRENVLSSIGAFGRSALGQISNETIFKLLEKFFYPMIQQEVHEGLICHMLQQMSSWSSRLTTTNSTLNEFFKKGLEQKTSTAATRTAYLQSILLTFKEENLVELIPIQTVLTSSYERGLNQPTQILCLQEAIFAALILSTIAQINSNFDSKLNSFWSSLNDGKKQIFASEKFQKEANPSACRAFFQFYEKLQANLHINEMSPYTRTFIHLMVHSGHDVRKQAFDIMRRLFFNLGVDETQLSNWFLNGFQNYLENFCSISAEVNLDSISKGFQDAFLSLGKAMKNQENARKYSVCGRALLICSSSRIFLSTEEEFWSKFVFLIFDKKNDEIEKFFRTNVDQLVEICVGNASLKKNQILSVGFLSAKRADLFLERFLDLFYERFQVDLYLTVTQRDYKIMKTPSGQLFDKSVMETILKHDVQDTGNIKRESKNYSYKEQMAARALEKELAAKQGKSDTPQLTKKQQEMLQQHLDQEQIVRERVKNIDENAKNWFEILNEIVRRTEEQFIRHVGRLVRTVWPALKSPLTFSYVRDLYLTLLPLIFLREKNRFAESLANLTIRLDSNDQENIDKRWLQETTSAAIPRLLTILFENTEQTKKAFQLCIARLEFILPLFKSIAGLANCDDIWLSSVISIVEEFLSIVSTNDKDNHPSVLPREDLLRLFLKINENSKSIQLQNNATKICEFLCELTNGYETDNDIEVLLDGLRSATLSVRESCALSLRKFGENLSKRHRSIRSKIARRLLIVCEDPEERIQKIAAELFPQSKVEIDSDDLKDFLEDIVHRSKIVRDPASKALSKLLENKFSSSLPFILTDLFEIYQKNNKLPPALVDQYGRQIQAKPVDHWEARAGVAATLLNISNLLGDNIEELFKFFIPTALTDRNEDVRNEMLQAATTIVEVHGKENLTLLLKIMEEFLKDAPKTADYDFVRQCVVILMGKLAKDMDKDSNKVKNILGQLISTLNTPSQQVQAAVADCLPPLVPVIKEEAGVYIQQLLALLLKSEDYAEKKGAAYGLAGFVKGLGILSVKQYNVLNELTEALQDKANGRRREGALFGLEMLTLMLGRLFEVYIVNIIPNLLVCFGDHDAKVREAAEDCARAIMSKLSSHGVKIVLPGLLKGLESDLWRTKCGAVELLGAMAHCAPKQMSTCLPSIVPKLIEVLTDSHQRVQNSGTQALREIGSVIKNPEIQAIVPVLLDALQEPTKKTQASLQTLIQTRFIHFIDAPSLALIIPVIERAFKNRSTETRKMAAQIIGNIYSLTDSKDLSPYLPHILPGLKTSLLDPVPEVRAVSAHALGAMVRAMGEEAFQEIVPWLMEHLVLESSPVDRSGAAQGLSEVIFGLGADRLEKSMQEIIDRSQQIDLAAHVRDGYMMMFIYLPISFGTKFIPYVGKIIPPILKGLADETEFVRDTALKAGQRIISSYSETAISLFVPELERGLFDDNWRIRYSSVLLLGELLFKISGVTGKATTESVDEDDNFGSETGLQSVTTILGRERRDRVLSGLYMGRSDIALTVRQSALHVWKTVISNTPRTLREILQTLFSLLLGCLASSNFDKRQIAARTLGDLVRKLGERVLPEIIPILEKGLDSPHRDQRQGVCIGLSEIMTACSREYIIAFSNTIIPTVKRALLDPLVEVRQSAAKTFENLHSSIGNQALDEVLPFLLNSMKTEVAQTTDDSNVSDDFALDALQRIMQLKSRVVLPYLVPHLVQVPVNIKALSRLTLVAGDALARHLPRIIQAVVNHIADEKDASTRQENLHFAEQLIAAVNDTDGIQIVIREFQEFTHSPKVNVRLVSIELLLSFCKSSKSVYQEHIDDLLRITIGLFSDENEEILSAAWECTEVLIKDMESLELQKRLPTIRQTLRITQSNSRERGRLPGLCLQKKGIGCILPIYKECILNGPPDLRESAANGLNEAINLSDAEALKSSIMNVTGPLIRVLGERFSTDIKVAILETLTTFMSKVGVQLKPFLPQLQPTLLKGLNDPARPVRLKAGNALGFLSQIHVRIDPIFVEILNGLKMNDDAAFKETFLLALKNCLTAVGTKVSDDVRKQIEQSLVNLKTNENETVRQLASSCKEIL